MIQKNPILTQKTQIIQLEAKLFQMSSLNPHQNTCITILAVPPAPTITVARKNSSSQS
jgi:hypothetical protein